MREKALILVIVFLFLIPMIWLSIRWLWELICKVAGVTKQEVRLYRIKVRHNANPHKMVIPWMLSKTENQKKLRRLLRIYQACILPNLLCLTLAIAGLFTPVFDKFLDCASIVMTALVLMLTLVGIIYRKTRTS